MGGNPSGGVQSDLAVRPTSERVAVLGLHDRE
jgi:hypothetical protein